MVVIFGKQLNHSSPIEVSTKILSNDGNIFNNTNDLGRIINNYLTHIANIIVWITLSIKMILVNHVYLIMITIEL